MKRFTVLAEKISALTIFQNDSSTAAITSCEVLTNNTTPRNVSGTSGKPCHLGHNYYFHFGLVKRPFQ